MIMATLGVLGGAWPYRRQIVVSVGTTPDAVVDATLDMAVDASLDLIVRLSLDGIASERLQRTRLHEELDGIVGCRARRLGRR